MVLSCQPVSHPWPWISFAFIGQLEIRKRWFRRIRAISSAEKSCTLIPCISYNWGPFAKSKWRHCSGLDSAAATWPTRILHVTVPNWIVIVTTSFTDSPQDAMANSGFMSISFSLSMITNTEQQLLIAEHLWAHAIRNVKFPGLLWTFPGLMSLKGVNI